MMPNQVIEYCILKLLRNFLDHILNSILAGADIARLTQVLHRVCGVNDVSVSMVRVCRGEIHRTREGKRQPPPAPPV
jgi:hypothetical protein